jgi:hypothetical protein
MQEGAEGELLAKGASGIQEDVLDKTAGGPLMALASGLASHLMITGGLADTIVVDAARSARRPAQYLFLPEAHRANVALRRGPDVVTRCRTHADEERRNRSSTVIMILRS